jgi:pheromone shutdown-related protein TraB
MNYKNIVFLGTSHIAKQSLDEVKEAIEMGKPDIVALELDRPRLEALMSKAPRKLSLGSVRHIGLKGFIFSAIGAWAEKKLGKIAGVSPGSEMKQAVKLAKKHGIKVSLIDQDIQITLSRLSKAITWKEKWNFLADMANGIFKRDQDLRFDLRIVPEKKLIKKLVERLKKRYPNIHKVLIDERNKVLASRLARLMEAEPGKKILAIIGAGHVDDVIELMKNKEKGVISYSFSVGSQNQ